MKQNNDFTLIAELPTVTIKQPAQHNPTNTD